MMELILVEVQNLRNAEGYQNQKTAGVGIFTYWVEEKFNKTPSAHFVL